MKFSRKPCFFPSTVYTFYNDQTAPPSTTEIPTQSPPHTPASMAVSFLPPVTTTAATKVQSAYRSYLVRTLFKRIRAVNSEAARLEKLIQRQETVDAVRTDDSEKIRVNEALMALLLTLDSVPGVNSTVRDLRRAVSRRIVGLQEVLDSVAEARDVRYGWSGFLDEWDEVVEEIEVKACRERGGEEFEMFCAEKLGFRCLQKFLRQS